MRNADHPIRIYLDQKDFSRIGKGLVGNPQCAEEAKAFERLSKLEQEGLVRFYFSWCHVFEALKYDEAKVSHLDPYCDAVDSLCKGRCLRWPPEIVHAEVYRFLTREFGLPMSNSDDYPYGRFLDHFPPIPYEVFDEISLDRLRTWFRSDVIPRLPRSQRNEAEENLACDQFMKFFLLSLPREFLAKFLPGMNLSGQELVEMVFGDTKVRKRILRSKFEALGSFREMIRFSLIHPQFKNLGTSDNAYFLSVKQLLKLQQGHFDKYDPDRNMDPGRVRQGLVENYLDFIDEHISEFCGEVGINPDQAKSRLRGSSLKRIPSLDAVVTFQVEYYRHHRGRIERSRTPAQSDVMDLQHIFFLPYVDIYSTDAFFPEVARKAARTFDTHVIKNTTDALRILDTEFGVH